DAVGVRTGGDVGHQNDEHRGEGDEDLLGHGPSRAGRGLPRGRLPLYLRRSTGAGAGPASSPAALTVPATRSRAASAARRALPRTEGASRSAARSSAE